MNLALAGSSTTGAGPTMLAESPLGPVGGNVGGGILVVVVADVVAREDGEGERAVVAAGEVDANAWDKFGEGVAVPDAATIGSAGVHAARIVMTEEDSIWPAVAVGMVGPATGDTVAGRPTETGDGASTRARGGCAEVNGFVGCSISSGWVGLRNEAVAATRASLFARFTTTVVTAGSGVLATAPPATTGVDAGTPGVTNAMLAVLATSTSPAATSGVTGAVRVVPLAAVAGPSGAHGPASVGRWGVEGWRPAEAAR